MKSSRKTASNISGIFADNKHCPFYLRVVLIILKRFSVLLIPTLLLALMPKAYAEMDISTSAQACVLMYEDGRCLYEKNADDKNLIASTTKLMTAIVSIENAELDDKVKVKTEHCAVEGSSMYLKAGEKYTVKELLLGLLLASGNDAALALAEHVSGGSREFAALMNEKANELGMNNSSFANPHGLDERGHYSTARDMAILMLYCMDNPTFKELTSTYTATVKDQSYTNHNKLLVTYPGCIGGKTGFTSAAGRCLVSCCERDGVRLVCVTLSDPDDWKDHASLYDYAFEQYCLRDIGSEAVFQIPLISGSKESITVAPNEEFKFFMQRDEKIELRVEIPAFIFAPVKIGETAGKICVIIKNNVVAELPLVYTEDAVIAYPCMAK